MATRKKRAKPEDQSIPTVTMPLSQIICGQLNLGPDVNWIETIGAIRCTDIGSRIANSLIRVAATRIFADPAQSILEPIVNSIDAYGTRPNTGKFGMGFFSLLYWVVHYNATLQIDSVYQAGSKLYAFIALIRQGNDGTIMFIVQESHLLDRDQTGTTIEVRLPQDRVFEAEQIESFVTQVRKLGNVDGVTLTLSQFEIDHDTDISEITFSSDERLCALVAVDVLVFDNNNRRFADITRYALMRVPDDENDDKYDVIIYMMEFSPDGSMLAIATNETITVWDLTQLEQPVFKYDCPGPGSGSFTTVVRFVNNDEILFLVLERNDLGLSTLYRGTISTRKTSVAMSSILAMDFTVLDNVWLLTFDGYRAVMRSYVSDQRYKLIRSDITVTAVSGNKRVCVNIEMTHTGVRNAVLTDINTGQHITIDLRLDASDVISVHLNRDGTLLAVVQPHQIIVFTREGNRLWAKEVSSSLDGRVFMPPLSDQIAIVEGKNHDTVTLYNAMTGVPERMIGALDEQRVLNRYSGDESRHVIHTVVDSNRFSVQDFATGITREVLLKTLVVPGLSTKTIAMSERTSASKYEPTLTSYIASAYELRFTILVNQIEMMSVETPIERGSGFDFSIRVDLPPWTRVPVSRDDVMLESVRAEFMAGIAKLQAEMFARHRTIVPLELSMKAAIKHTASEANKQIYADAIDQMYNSLGNVLTIAPEHASLYADGGFEAVSVLNPDRDRLEATLTRLVKPSGAQPFYNRTVIYVDRGAEASDGGTNSFVFVPRQVITTFGKQWPQIIATSSFSVLLYLDQDTSTSEYLTRAFQEDLGLLKTNAELVGVIKETLDVLVLCGKNGWRVHPREETTIGEMITAYSQQLVQLYKHGVSLNVLRMNARNYLTKYSRGPAVYTYDSSGSELALYLDVEYELPFSGELVNLPQYNKQIHPKASVFVEQLMRYAVDNVDPTTDTELTDIIEPCLFPILVYLSDDAEEEWYYPVLTRLLNMCENAHLFFWCFSVLVYYQNNNVFASTRVSIYNNSPENIAYFLLSYFGRNLPKLPFLKVHSYAFRFDTFETAKAAVALQETFRVPDIVNANQFRIKSSAQFSLNDFIAYSFQEEYSTLDINYFLYQVQNIPPRTTNLQLLGIAVNEGTTKDIIPAQLTETIQNAVDALRITDAPRYDIEIDINRARGNLLLLEIWDPVGMTLDNIVALSIPFYSNKTAGQIATGEIGTGFFNVYRGSRRVSIKTRRRENDAKTIHIVDTPKPDASGRVEDVTRELSITDPSRFYGTKISILSKYSDELDIIRAYSKAVQFVMQVIALMPIPLTIRLNGELVNKKTERWVDTPQYEVYRISKSSEELPITSYIMTNGIPFAPLEEYLTQLNNNRLSKPLVEGLRSHLVVNIKPGSYTPTQTRTKLVLADEDALVPALLDALYLNNMCPENLQYYYNTGDVDQVLPRRNVVITEFKSIKQFMMHYTHTAVGRSIAEMLHDIRTTYRTQFPDRTRFHPDQYDGASWEGRVVHDIVEGWLRAKTIVTEEARRKDTLAEKAEVARITNMDSSALEQRFRAFVTRWITIYITAGRRLSIFKETGLGLPKVEVIAIQNSTSSYSPSTNTITINIAAYKSVEVARILQLFQGTEDPLLTIKDWTENQSMYAWTDLMLDTIPHEIEHYRRQTAHNRGSGPHDPVKIYLPIGGDKVREYGPCAQDIMKSIIVYGSFYADLIKSM